MTLTSLVRRPVMVAGALLVLGGLPLAMALRPDATPPVVLTSGVAVAPVASTGVARGTTTDLREGVPPVPGRSVAPRAARGGVRRTPVAIRTRLVESVSFSQRGRASWYGPGFHGRRTANGERFDTGEMTAAHRTLPFGTRARVCTRRRCVSVRINDRGPFIAGRVVDLSHAAAQELGITDTGVARVTVSVVTIKTIREQVGGKAGVRPGVASRAAGRAPAVARPAPSAPVKAPLTDLEPLAVYAPADTSVDLPWLAGLGGVTMLLSFAPALALLRRREGLDFLR